MTNSGTVVDRDFHKTEWAGTAGCREKKMKKRGGRYSVQGLDICPVSVSASLEFSIAALYVALHATMGKSQQG